MNRYHRRCIHQGSVRALALLATVALPWLAACGGPPAGRPATDVVATASAGCREGEAEKCAVACNHGAVDACNEAGRAYEMGIGVSRSGVAANTFYRKACDLGDVSGCYNAAYLIENGLAGRRDVGCALALYRAACDAGHPRSCMSAGFIYKAGLEVPKDMERAADSFRKACDGGYSAGCQQLQSLD